MRDLYLTDDGVDRSQERLGICSGQRPWALKTHMNRLGACE